MKKVFISLLIFLSFSTYSLFADLDYLTVGTTGGFSFVKDTPSFGFNTSYQYMAKIGDDLYFGLNNHADFNLLLSQNDINFGTGVLIGPSFGYGFDASNFLTFTFAPAIYVETGTINNSRYEFIGLGLGLDLNHTFYLGTYKNFGLVIGATGYFMFTDLAKNNISTSSNIAGVGYIAFSFRSGDYVGESDVYYNIY